MKTNRTSAVLRLIVLGVLAASLNTKPATAQAFRGKFTLTSATRWGYVKLPAGEYSLTLHTDLSPCVLTVFRGTQSVAEIRTGSMKSISSGRSEMVLQDGAVRELSLPQIGVSLHYTSPNSGPRTVPQEPQLAQNIPVAAVGMGR